MKQSLAKPPTIPWSKSRIWGFPGDSVVKHQPTNAGNTGYAVLMPGWKDTLEKKTATHSNILAQEIEWTEEYGGLQSTGSQNSWIQLSN